jgi:hypothetical protein
VVDNSIYSTSEKNKSPKIPGDSRVPKHKFHTLLVKLNYLK